MDQLIQWLTEFKPNIIILSVLSLCFIVVGCVTASALKNINKFGNADELKFKFAYRALFNFIVSFLIFIDIVIRLLSLISNDLFLAILIVSIASLGVKLSFDIFGNIKLGND